MQGRVAIIGTGAMGSALIKGLAQSGSKTDLQIIAVDIDETKLQRIETKFGVATTTSVGQAITQANAVVLAIKPWVVPEILKECGPQWPEDCLLLSVAAGVTIFTLERFLASQVPVVRAMPNTPGLIGAGVTALAAGRAASDENLKLAEEILSTLGEVVTVQEKDLDAVTGLSGSGPAYVYLFIEALIDAGVREGLSRDVSRKLALQTVLGAAKLVQESGEHPAKLKDAVTTPGGTTIAGLAALEGGAFRGLIFEAVRNATEVSRFLGKDE